VPVQVPEHLQSADLPSTLQLPLAQLKSQVAPSSQVKLHDWLALHVALQLEPDKQLILQVAGSAEQLVPQLSPSLQTVLLPAFVPSPLHPSVAIAISTMAASLISAPSL